MTDTPSRLSRRSSDTDLEFWNQLEDRPSIDERVLIRRATMRHVNTRGAYSDYRSSPDSPSIIDGLSPDTVYNTFMSFD